MIPLVRTRFDKWALPVAVLGVAAAAAYNWRQWQRDKAFLAARPEPEPLPPLSEWPALPLVSVLVAAWNESAHIDRHIQSFLALRYPHKELVLCAGGDDDTLERACRYAGPDVKVLPQQAGEGKQRALARSFPETQGEVIFLTDADCELADEPFERTLWPVAVGEEQVATGGLQPIHDQVVNSFIQAQWAPTHYMVRYDSSPIALGLSGINTALQSVTFEQTLQTSELVPTGTDYYLALQLREQGHTIARVRDSEVATVFPDTLRAYIRQRGRWLRNLLLWGYRFQDWQHVRAAIVSMCLGTLMIALPLLTPVLGVILLAMWLPLWAHALVARARYGRFLQLEEGLPLNLPINMYTFAVPLADFVAGAKVAVDLLSSEGRKKW